VSKRIGFDRKLELAWLDATVGECQKTDDAVRIAARLDEFLAGEIAGPEARRKTITVLTRIWVRVPQEHHHLRAEALELAGQVRPAERLWLHWGLALLAYPFFRDVAAVVGRLSELQQIFTLSQVQRRLVEGWGQRTTLEHAARRTVRTLVLWEVLADADAPGHYTLMPRQHTDNETLALWFLAAVLQARGQAEMPLHELLRAPEAVAFELLPYAGAVRRAERFAVSRQGLDVEMVGLA